MDPLIDIPVRAVAYVGEPHALTPPIRVTGAPPGVSPAAVLVEGDCATFPAPGLYLVETGPQRFRVAVYHREAATHRHLSHDAYGYRRSDDARNGILLAIARHVPIHTTTRERPLPGVSLAPYGGDHGQ